jgi:hypothetical protein
MNVVPVEAMEAVRLNSEEAVGTMDQGGVRHYGRVLYYDSRPQERYGFIEELGSWGHDPLVAERVYFNMSFVREHSGTNVGCPLIKFCPGDIVEYTRTDCEHNDELSYRAYDVTGLHEGKLPCHYGVVTFTPYHVAMKKIARQDVHHGQAHFEAVHNTYAEKEANVQRMFTDMTEAEDE